MAELVTRLMDFWDTARITSDNGDPCVTKLLDATGLSTIKEV
jgi:hypothetical protein